LSEVKIIIDFTETSHPYVLFKDCLNLRV